MRLCNFLWGKGTQLVGVVFERWTLGLGPFWLEESSSSVSD